MANNTYFHIRASASEQMTPGDVNPATVICVSELFHPNLCSALMYCISPSEFAAKALSHGYAFILKDTER